jgi:hypothetical protein
MIEFKRSFFLKDPVLNQIYQIIKGNHTVASHTQKVLAENKHIKDFCEESRNFVMLPGKKPLFLHYDVASWYHSEDGATVKIDSIAVYDGFMEYEKARLSQLHGAKVKEIPNIN